MHISITRWRIVSQVCLSCINLPGPGRHRQCQEGKQNDCLHETGAAFICVWAVDCSSLSFRKMKHMELLKINKIEYVVPLCSQNIKQDCRYDTELFTRYRASCKYENSIIRYLKYLERKGES